MRNGGHVTYFDIVAIQLDHNEAAALSNFGAYELGSIVPARLNEPVSIAGYPGIGAGSPVIKTFDAKVEQVVDVSVLLSQPSEHGYSGSPLVGPNGLIGMIHGDIGHEPNLTNGLAISFSVLGPHLFV